MVMKCDFFFCITQPFDFKVGKEKEVEIEGVREKRGGRGHYIFVLEFLLIPTHASHSYQ